jgi:MacB-like periplasmic core domain
MWSDILYRLRALFRSRSMERDLTDELEFHSARQLEKSQHAGLTPAEAARLHRLAFGGNAQIQEECRDARGVNFLQNLGRDTVYAIRVLSKSKAFTAVAVLILALGIGANTAAFSFVNAILLKKLPVARPDELVLIRYYTDGHGPFVNYRYPTFHDFEQHNTAFAGVLGRFPTYFHLAADSSPARVSGEFVSSAYFQTLGVGAIIGRPLTADDNGVEGASPVCTITYQLWQERFAGDPNILSRQIQLDSHPFQIVGVMQPGFRGTELQARHDVFVPMSMIEMFLGNKRDDNGWSFVQQLGQHYGRIVRGGKHFQVRFQLLRGRRHLVARHQNGSQQPVALGIQMLRVCLNGGPGALLRLIQPPRMEPRERAVKVRFGVIHRIERY